jgi:hypothetical protein
MVPLHFFKLAAACGTKTGGLPSIWDGIQCKPDASGNLTPTITHVSDVLVIIANVIRIVMALSGAIAIIVIVVASIYYITSLGAPERIKRARDIIQYAAIGLLLITMAYAIMTYVAGAF